MIHDMYVVCIGQCRVGGQYAGMYGPLRRPMTPVLIYQLLCLRFVSKLSYGSMNINVMLNILLFPCCSTRGGFIQISCRNNINTHKQKRFVFKSTVYLSMGSKDVFT